MVWIQFPDALERIVRARAVLSRRRHVACLVLPAFVRACSVESTTTSRVPVCASSACVSVRSVTRRQRIVCVQGRAQQPVHIRGGVLADQVGYRKTAITLH